MTFSKKNNLIPLFTASILAFSLALISFAFTNTSETNNLTTNNWVNTVESSFFEETNHFMQKHVRSGKVNYSAIQSDPTALNALVSQIESFQKEGKSVDFPFYMNAYNILVIKSVIDNYPIGSPMDVKGFFDAKPFTVAGESLTLNDIENKVIRPTYQDARIHFALVCGAIGCPKLISKGFTSSNYNSLLEANTKSAMNDDYFIRVDDANQTVAISKIFEWYTVDFGGSDEGIMNFINKYRNSPIPADYNITYYEYDWTLNKQ